MLKYLYLFLIVLITSCASNKASMDNATSGNYSEFLSKYGNQFIKQTALADYLVMYDKMAWYSTDTIMKYEKENMEGKMGAEWFGYQKEDDFILTYGAFKEDLYHPFVRYTISDNNTIVKAYQYDSLVEWRYAKAINMVKDSASEVMKKHGHGYNWYVYTDSVANNIKVLYLPALGDNFEIVYGNEFSYTLSANADTVIKKDISNNTLKYYMLNTEEDIVIYDKNENLPDIGNLYGIRRWVSSKSNVYIKTKNYLFALLKDDKNEFTWFTVTK